MANQYTEEERRDFVQQIGKMRQEGITQAKACKTLGISTFSYFDWKKRYASDVSEVVVTRLPETTTRRYTPRSARSTGKLAVIIGNPESISQFLGTYL